MNIDLSHVLPASRETVWKLLHDPARMAGWIPGCERLEASGPDTYTATLSVGVAAVKGTYTGTVEIKDKAFPSRYTLVVEGNGQPGFVRGTATMELTEESADQTRLAIKAQAQVGGLIASVGQRFLGGIAKQLTQQMLQSIEQELRREAGS